MGKYIPITTATTTTLITKGAVSDHAGGVKKITICNNSANAATSISVHLYSGVGGEPVHPFVHNVTIPSGVTLVLEDNIGFDANKYKLRISNAGTDPDLTVIIK